MAGGENYNNNNTKKKKKPTDLIAAAAAAASRIPRPRQGGGLLLLASSSSSSTSDLQSRLGNSRISTSKFSFSAPSSACSSVASGSNSIPTMLNQLRGGGASGDGAESLNDLSSGSNRSRPSSLASSSGTVGSLMLLIRPSRILPPGTIVSAKLAAAGAGQQGKTKTIVNHHRSTASLPSPVQQLSTPPTSVRSSISSKLPVSSSPATTAAIRQNWNRRRLLIEESCERRSSTPKSRTTSINRSRNQSPSPKLLPQGKSPAVIPSAISRRPIIGTLTTPTPGRKQVINYSNTTGSQQRWAKTSHAATCDTLTRLKKGNMASSSSSVVKSTDDAECVNRPKMVTVQQQPGGTTTTITLEKRNSKFLMGTGTEENEECAEPAAPPCVSSGTTSKGEEESPLVFSPQGRLSEKLEGENISSSSILKSPLSAFSRNTQEKEKTTPSPLGQVATASGRFTCSTSTFGGTTTTQEEEDVAVVVVQEEKIQKKKKTSTSSSISGDSVVVVSVNSPQCYTTNNNSSRISSSWQQQQPKKSSSSSSCSYLDDCDTMDHDSPIAQSLKDQGEATQGPSSSLKGNYQTTTTSDQNQIVADLNNLPSSAHGVIEANNNNSNDATGMANNRRRCSSSSSSRRPLSWVTSTSTTSCASGIESASASKMLNSPSSSVVGAAESREMLTRLENERRSIRGSSLLLHRPPQPVLVAADDQLMQMLERAAGAGEMDLHHLLLGHSVEKEEETAVNDGEELTADDNKKKETPQGEDNNHHQQQQQQHPHQEAFSQRSLSLPKSFLSNKYGLSGLKAALPWYRNILLLLLSFSFLFTCVLFW